MEYEESEIHVEKCYIDKSNKDLWIHIFRSEHPHLAYPTNTDLKLYVRTMNFAFKNPSFTSGGKY